MFVFAHIGVGYVPDGECQWLREECVLKCQSAVLLPGFNFVNAAACVEALCPKCGQSNAPTQSSTPGYTASPGQPTSSGESPIPINQSAPSSPSSPSSSSSPTAPVETEQPASSGGSAWPMLLVAGVGVGIFIAVVR